MTSTHSHDALLKKIQTILSKTSEMPPLERAFPFPWKEAEDALGELLGIPHLSFSSHFSSWHPSSQKNVSSSCVISLELSPLLGAVHFLMSHEDVAHLSSFCLNPDHSTEGFSDPRLQEGYYKFLVLQILQTLDRMKIFKDASLKCISWEEPLTSESLCLNISITLPSKTIHGTLLLPEVFLDHFKNYKPFQTLSLLNNESIQDKEFTLHFEIGKLSLSTEIWQSATSGDFLVLDHSNYDPDSHKGSLVISLERTPLFQGRIKPDGIKILDFLPASTEEASEQELTSTELKIELEPICMSLKKILDLKPDSILEISPHPEQTVLLTINSTVVGEGELLKLGEVVGVRILTIFGT